MLMKQINALSALPIRFRATTTDLAAPSRHQIDWTGCASSEIGQGTITGFQIKDETIATQYADLLLRSFRKKPLPKPEVSFLLTDDSEITGLQLLDTRFPQTTKPWTSQRLAQTLDFILVATRYPKQPDFTMRPFLIGQWIISASNYLKQSLDRILKKDVLAATGIHTVSPAHLARLEEAAGALKQQLLLAK